MWRGSLSKQNILIPAVVHDYSLDERALVKGYFIFLQLGGDKSCFFGLASAEYSVVGGTDYGVHECGLLMMSRRL